MANDREPDEPSLEETFNGVARPELDPAKAFNHAAGVEPPAQPPSTPRKVLTLTPGGTLEQIVHTVVDSRGQVSLQLRDTNDGSSATRESDEGTQRQPAEEMAYNKVRHNRYEWEHYRGSATEAYRHGEDDGIAIITQEDEMLPLDGERSNAKLQTCDPRTGEWQTVGVHSLQEALDRGEDHIDRCLEQERTSKYQERMNHRTERSSRENDREGHER